MLLQYVSHRNWPCFDKMHCNIAFYLQPSRSIRWTCLAVVNNELTFWSAFETLVGNKYYMDIWIFGHLDIMDIWTSWTFGHHGHLDMMDIWR